MTVSVQPKSYDLFIDGKRVPSASGQTFPSYNPATNEVLANVAKAGLEDVNRAVAAARRAFDSGPWSRLTAQDRQRILMKLAALVRERAEDLAALDTQDCGKPIAEARGDVANTAHCFEYYAAWAPRLYGQTIPMPGQLLDYTLREPFGVCALIVPWNFPLLLATWKIAPCLAAGNTAIVKPASNTPLSVLVLAELAMEAGLPDGVLNVLPGPGKEIGRALVSHPDVDKVSFTGETETGRDILKMSADTIKKVTLELGGKSPSVIFDDCHLEQAVNGSLLAIYGNAGQRCTARSRLLVQEGIHDDFVELFVSKARRIRIGDPLRNETQMGPLVSRSQLQKVASYIDVARGEGGEIVCGGERPSDPELQQGNFFTPTVVDRVTNNMRVAQEEVFGPILSVLTFRTEDEAIDIANNVIYGLAGSVWTRDIKRAHNVARRLRAGNISINHPTVNYIEAPFGGYKQSGIGRELGPQGIDIFTQWKNVVVDLSADGVDWFKL